MSRRDSQNNDEELSMIEEVTKPEHRYPFQSHVNSKATSVISQLKTKVNRKQASKTNSVDLAVTMPDGNIDNRQNRRSSLAREDSILQLPTILQHSRCRTSSINPLTITHVDNISNDEATGKKYMIHY
jgi:hypothetical protein